jgi:hypothetical protein
MIGLFFVMSLFSFTSDLHFKGMIQTWFSVAEQPLGEGSEYGFTFRRVRFKPYGSFSKNIRWLLQVGWDRNSALLLDAYIDFTISKAFRIRIGQFPAPGSISGTLSSSGKLDFLERALVTQKWGGFNKFTGYRALGIQFHGDLLGEKLYYAVMAANQDTAEPFIPRLKSSEYDNKSNGARLWARLEAGPVPGLRIGTFFGTTKETGTLLRKSSYGAHLFFVKKGLNFKIEYIAGSDSLQGINNKYNGMYAVLGYKLKKVEPICRYGYYTPDDYQSLKEGVEKFIDITIGINYFFKANIKFQANYVFRDEEMAAGLPELQNNLFYCCLQYTF